MEKSEIRQLKDLIGKGVPLDSIEIPGRTKIAIRNKSIRSGILKTKPHKLQLWNTKEINLLKRLVLECGYTSNALYANKWFPGRSKHAIAQQMRRLRIKKGW